MACMLFKHFIVLDEPVVKHCLSIGIDDTQPKLEHSFGLLHGLLRTYVHELLAQTLAQPKLVHKLGLKV